MSGLQRRRVNNTASADETWGSSERQTSTVPKTDEDGPKIGYDPKDIRTAEEEEKQPRLTLMEEVLLMGLKDQQGYLSFWNDNISYALRGCIIMELALRGKVQMVNDTNRRRFPISDRYIEVINDKLTGEALLDETIKIMKASEKLTVGTWINYLSGETWNLSKISYQLKQVRERLSKGLVDKGILRTEKRNFFLLICPPTPSQTRAPRRTSKNACCRFSPHVPLSSTHLLICPRACPSDTSDLSEQYVAPMLPTCLKTCSQI